MADERILFENNKEIYTIDRIYEMIRQKINISNSRDLILLFRNSNMYGRDSTHWHLNFIELRIERKRNFFSYVIF